MSAIDPTRSKSIGGHFISKVGGLMGRGSSNSNDPVMEIPRNTTSMNMAAVQLERNATKGT